MAGKKKGINKTMLKVTILVLTFAQMATNGLSPVMADVAAEFPEAATSTVQMLMTLPGVFVVILSMISAWLTSVFPKKYLIGTGSVCICGTGILGVLFHGSLSILFAWSCLMGIGMGLISALTVSLISDYFDGQEKTNMMGLQTGAANIGGMIMTAIGGVLTAIAWQYDYFVYLLGLPGLILLILFVPKNEVVRKKSDTGKETGLYKDGDSADAREKVVGLGQNESANALTGSEKTADVQKGKMAQGEGKTSKKGGLFAHGQVWVYVVISVFLLFLFNAGPTNLSMYVTEFGIGNSTVSGMAATVFLLGGTLMGILFGAFSKKLGRFTIPLGFLLMAIGFFVIQMKPNIVCMYVGCFIAGMSISLVSPQCVLQTSSFAKTSQELALAAAIVMAASNVGTFLTPQLTNVARMVTGSESTRYRFVLALVLAVVMAVLTFVFTLLEKRRESR